MRAIRIDSPKPLPAYRLLRGRRIEPYLGLSDPEDLHFAPRRGAAIPSPVISNIAKEEHIASARWTERDVFPVDGIGRRERVFTERASFEIDREKARSIVRVIMHVVHARMRAARRNARDLEQRIILNRADPVRQPGAGTAGTVGSRPRGGRATRVMILAAREGERQTDSTNGGTRGEQTEQSSPKGRCYARFIAGSGGYGTGSGRARPLSFEESNTVPYSSPYLAYLFGSALKRSAHEGQQK